MSDEIVVKNEGGGESFAPLPEGSYFAVCVDVINLGEKVETYKNNPPKIKKKVAIVFQVAEENPDTGKPYEISVEKTVSFYETAGLRQFLGNWRGKQYTEEEADNGIPLHKLTGVNAMLIVEHQLSKAGRRYAKIQNVAPPAKGSTKVVARDYQRGEYWEKRKAEYAAGVQAHNATQPAAPIAAAMAGAESDDLPF